jgi:hypothetical protein
MPLGVPSTLSKVLGLDSGESWRDRLREGAFVAPSGTRIEFDFVDVERAGSKRGTAFEFPGVDGAYIQQHGVGARRYPMLCIFSGADHDRVATAFEKAVYEAGFGKLEHPLYGKIPDIVTFGEITRRDPLVSAANQSIVEVTFWKALREVYPNGGKDAQSEIDAALEGFDVEASQAFANKTNLLTAARRAAGGATVRSFLRDVSSTLRSASDDVSAVRREMDEPFATVNYGLDVLVGQPLLLAQQVCNLVQAPGRALAGLRSRLDGYLAFARRIFASPAGRVLSVPTAAVGLALKQKNDFHIAHLFAQNAVAGVVVTNRHHPFRTRPEALDAAARMADLADEVTDWSEAAHEVLSEEDPGDAARALQQAVAIAEGYLVELSFTLLPERRITLNRNRTIIDLAAELYGSVDDKLDLLITSNGLTGSEILELPAGRVIKYYPET